MVIHLIFHISINSNSILIKVFASGQIKKKFQDSIQKNFNGESSSKMLKLRAVVEVGVANYWFQFYEF